MTQKIIKKGKFDQLDRALRKAVQIDRLEKELAKRREENRALLLELGESLVDDNSRTAVPGFEIHQNTDVKFDEKAALAYAKRPDVFAAASSLLSVEPDCVGVLIGLALQIESALERLAAMPETDETVKIKSLFSSVNLRNIFQINKAGYAAAVRSERFNDIPHTAKTERLTVKITAGAVKTGTELAKEFVIVPDEETVEV
jgi:hypothetical protein